MFRIARPNAIFLSAVLLLACVVLRSQTPSRVPALIHEVVDENKLVKLTGNTRPEANTDYDLGESSDGLGLDHMMLLLKRSPQQELAVEKLIADLHDPKSAIFHKWLTATEFGKTYGLAESDIRTISSWLESNGFVVNSVYPNGMVIDFSGTAGQVRRAFHTVIHDLDVNGTHHFANFDDPAIPEALAPAVAGIVSLHDFRPRKMIVPQYTIVYEQQTYHPVVPADLATIYDFNPLFAKGIAGQGQTIAVIEDTDLFSSQDWTTFRKAFGLSQYTSGSLATVHPKPPSGSNNCSAPGVNSDDGEAILDAEWASAGAPGAAIVVAACADTTTDGLIIAMQNLINAANPPAIMSLSYGFCEAFNGAATNASFNTLYQQAVTEGISVFVAAGDEGAASCDANQPAAAHGIGVSGFASTPYNVAVGGTDFSDVVNGTSSKYWNAINDISYGSAVSYIPEIPWNDSCAGLLLAKFYGYSKSYGSEGFCSSDTARDNGFITTYAGSGGPSNCATGAPSVLGVASGTCAGYPKPSWQTGVSGIPDDRVRDIPDVSMFAANGIWGHFALFCFSDLDNGGASCSQAPEYWTEAGGTSLATPVLAATQALVNQSMGARQGNPNPVYYALAAATTSVFHPVTEGDIDVNCDGPYNCYGFLGTIDYGRYGHVFGTTYGGALSVSTSFFARAYAASKAWSFANGLGSVDAFNLVQHWGDQ